LEVRGGAVAWPVGPAGKAGREGKKEDVAGRWV